MFLNIFRRIDHLQIWMCGGRLEIIPCSRVGHIFRQRRPYGLGIDSMGRNAARTANIWLDEYIVLISSLSNKFKL